MVMSQTEDNIGGFLGEDPGIAAEAVSAMLNQRVGGSSDGRLKASWDGRNV
jgi:hypothetical protein